MNRKEMGIEDASLYRSLVRQTKKSGFHIFLHSITEEEAKKVETLRFSNHEVISLDFLKFFPNVTDLTLDHVQGLKNMNGISYLSKLKNLSIYDTYIEDFTPLTYCTELEYLDYMFEDKTKNCGREDFSFIKSFPCLFQIDLSGNKVRNLKFLENLTNITQVVLTDNPLESTVGIETLTNLEYLELENCGLTELNGVEQLKQLTSLYVQGNRFSSDQLAEYKQKFSYIQQLGL